MALYQNVSVTVTSLGGGVFQLAVGPDSFTFDGDQVRDMLSGYRKSPEYLLHQIALGLDAAGFVWQGKTLAQIKAAVEALTLKW